MLRWPTHVSVAISRKQCFSGMSLWRTLQNSAMLRLTFAGRSCYGGPRMFRLPYLGSSALVEWVSEISCGTQQCYGFLSQDTFAQVAHACFACKISEADRRWKKSQKDNAELNNVTADFPRAVVLTLVSKSGWSDRAYVLLVFFRGIFRKMLLVIWGCSTWAARWRRGTALPGRKNVWRWFYKVSSTPWGHGLRMLTAAILFSVCTACGQHFATSWGHLHSREAASQAVDQQDQPQTLGGGGCAQEFRHLASNSRGSLRIAYPCPRAFPSRPVQSVVCVSKTVLQSRAAFGVRLGAWIVDSDAPRRCLRCELAEWYDVRSSL